MELIVEEETRNHVIFEMVEVSMQMSFPVLTTSLVEKKVSVDNDAVVN